MKPPPFDYFVPTELEDALELLAQYGSDARVLAGGQSLIPEMNFRHVAPEVVIDLNQMASLKCIQFSDTSVSVGAMIRQTEVEQSDVLFQKIPILRKALHYVGYRQTRNRGTIGGSLAFADPAAELPAVARAADAEFELRSSRGVRRVSAHDFYTGPFSTVLRADELMTAVHLPIPPVRTVWDFVEQPVKTFGKAVLGIACRLNFNTSREVVVARIVLCGAGNVPVRVQAAEELLMGEPLTESVIDSAVNTIAESIEPPDDIHATPAYRRHLARSFARRILTRIAADDFE